MFKNFFRMLTLLTFLVSIGNVMGSATGLEDWRDDVGRPAPASVRRTADNLWEAVKTEGGAAFDAGWGMGKQMPCGPKRIFLNIFTCGYFECAMACCGEYNKFDYSAQRKQAPLLYESKQQIYEQRTKEVYQALTTFKDTVNAAVLNPVEYSGDANICTLGLWVEDGAWHIQSLFVSGRRDLSTVTQSVKAFVNAHGGWNLEGKGDK